MTAKLLTLQEWASATYSKPPCYATLRNWIAAGKIIPAPVRHGRAYMFRPEARHIAEVIAESSSLIRKTRR